VLLEEVERLLCLCERRGARKNERDFGHLLDLVSAGHNEGRDSRGRKGGCDSVSALSDIHLAVPAPPDLGGRKHASASAHVSEGSLAGASRSAARNTRDTSNGASGSPRHGRGLLARSIGHSVGLSVVLPHVCVDKVDDIGADGREKDLREGHGRGDLAIGIDRDGRTSSC
jgi:hypothetical protein